MFKEADFDDIRPYNDDEVNPAIRRITSNPMFSRIMDFLFPEKSGDEIISKLNKVNNVIDFQTVLMYHAIYAIVHKSSKGLTYSGFENIPANIPHLFISNHRDILLDSAILQILLLDYKLETTEITFGNNLMQNSFVEDIGRLNRMFTVHREISNKESYRNSQKLSAYIRHTLNEKKNSVWIAQRNGRTKDGNDLSSTAVLKMLNSSGDKGFLENFKDLNIITQSVSYEYEPCDELKVSELYKSKNKTYKKSRGEDISSIITGIVNQKGRIHFGLKRLSDNCLDEINKTEDNNKNFKLAEAIDKQIYENYKLWPNNYIAADLIENNNTFSKYYTSEEKETFNNYLETKLSNMEGDKNELKTIFIEIYSKPVFNFHK